MIDFPIIDAHLHLWDIKHLSYPWLHDVPVLNRNFLLDDYKKATKNYTIEKMVFMQCEVDTSQYQKEVEWISFLSKNEDSRIKGIISWAPLEKGEAVREDLEYLKKNPLVKGIRKIIQFEPDVEFCLNPDFIKGVNLLAEYGFSFAIGISYVHNKNILKFIEKVPEVKLILDHIGKPDIMGGKLDPWRDEIRQMSTFPNLYCKISSLATEANHKTWTIDDLRPYVDTVFESFGFNRTIFASDWPVSTQAASFDTCVRTIEELVSGASQTELRKLFHDNAIDFYSI